MEFHRSRGMRSLICLVAALVCASAPLAAQRGIDLLDAEQVLRAGDPPAEFNGTDAVRITVADATGVVQRTHERKTYKYDDGMFENFENNSILDPPASGGMVEWAQRFVIAEASDVVSARVCFLRPETDLSRSLDFTLRFYSDDVTNRVSNPGRRGGLSYNVEADIRRAGTFHCVLLRGHVVGKRLSGGAHWVGIQWNLATQKRLGGDHYSEDDQPEADRNMNAVHVTQVRNRMLPVPEDTPNDGWNDPRQGSRVLPATGLKAIGVSLVVAPTHAPTPTPDPDPDPDPTPDPDPDPGMDTSCTGGTCLLEDGRFRVLARYAQAGMPGQNATGSMSGGAGLYTFGGDEPELLVRMVDDCSGSGYWMLYAGAATDAVYSIAVRDTMSNELKWFRARAGMSIRDMAFACSN